MPPRNKILATLVMLILGGHLSAGSPADTGELISRIATAGPSDRPALVYRLSLAGPEALSLTRKARDSASDEELRNALARACRWQLARKLAPALLEGFETQLTYAGQYVDLLTDDPEVVEALLALIEDAATDIRVRFAACRAHEDAVDPKVTYPGGKHPPGLLKDSAELLSPLRKLYHDVLLPEPLREQMGILLAVLGDTHAVDSALARLEKLAAGGNAIASTQSHLQLATLYDRLRDYEKAVRSYERVLAFFERIIAIEKRGRNRQTVLASLARELAPHYYNTACSSALNRDIEKAKTLLRKAVELDALHLENLQKDGDLTNLRNDPTYGAFREELKRLAED